MRPERVEPSLVAPAGRSVSQVQSLIGQAVTAAGLRQLWVAGTVSRLRRRGRVTSFELVEYGPDARTVLAAVPVTLFGRDGTHVGRLLGQAGVALADGLVASFWGELQSNGAYGLLRFVARTVDARVTVGATALARDELVAARDELVAALEASGELGAQRRLPVPALPTAIGLIASGGAGVNDVLGELEAHPYHVRVRKVEVAMNGPGAPQQVAAALASLCTTPLELILLAGDGGAVSDRAGWDSPEVAHAIAGCPLPVWTALGHASDHSVADLVGQRVFPTPSAAAAELVAMGERAFADERRATEIAGREAARARARARAVTLAVIGILALVPVLLVLARR